MLKNTINPTIQYNIKWDNWYIIQEFLDLKMVKNINKESMHLQTGLPNNFKVDFIFIYIELSNTQLPPV